MRQKTIILLQALFAFLVVFLTISMCLATSAVVVMHLFSFENVTDLLMNGTFLSLTVLFGSILATGCIYFINKKLL